MVNYIKVSERQTNGLASGQNLFIYQKIRRTEKSRGDPDLCSVFNI